MNDNVISLLLNTPCNGDQARVFAAAKNEIDRLQRCADIAVSALQEIASGARDPSAAAIDAQKRVMAAGWVRGA